jgi:hypothetical protein
MELNLSIKPQCSEPFIRGISRMHDVSLICRPRKGSRELFQLARLVLCFVSILLCSVGVADDLTAEHLLSIKSSFIELSDTRGTVVDKIRRSWIVNLVTVSQRMAQTYRLLTPTLVIVKQSEPNALVVLRQAETLLLVSTDMLRLIGDDEDLMAAMVGHELAHLRMSQWRHGHAVRQLFSVDRLTAASTADGRIAEPSHDSKSLNVKFAASGSTVSSVGFSDQQEHQVDALSIRAMVTTGYDPEDMLQFWRLMRTYSGGLDRVWLIEHPLNPELLRSMRSLANSLAEIYAANKAVRVSVDNQLVLFGARIAKMPVTTTGLDGVNGAMVSEVLPQSAAAAAGIAPGDILLRVDGTPIDNPDDLKLAVADATRGSMVEVKLLRGAVPVWVRLQL